MNYRLYTVCCNCHRVDTGFVTLCPECGTHQSWGHQQIVLHRVWGGFFGMRFKGWQQPDDDHILRTRHEVANLVYPHGGPPR